MKLQSDSVDRVLVHEQGSLQSKLAKDNKEPLLESETKSKFLGYQTTKLKITGMTCASCVGTVEVCTNLLIYAIVFIDT